MNDSNVIVTILGGATLVMGIGSKWLARSPFPPILLALVIGVLISPEVINLLDPEKMG